jgi:hypothetical protein
MTEDYQETSVEYYVYYRIRQFAIYQRPTQNAIRNQGIEAPCACPWKPMGESRYHRTAS